MKENNLSMQFYRWSKHSRLFYLLNIFLFNCEVSKRAEIGEGTEFRHNGNGLIISGEVNIGKNCIIHSNIIVGAGDGGEKVKGLPTIEDNVKIYPFSVIVGGITIGKNTVIGTGCFVDKDIPQNSVVLNGKKIKVINNENK